MLTVLFVVILVGICSWIIVNRSKSHSRPYHSPTTSSTPPSVPQKGRWDWAKEEKVQKILKILGVAILVFGVFNLALWAGMNEFQGVWGNSYFWNTWMLSPVFLLLAAIVIALAFLGKKKDSKDGENRFGPFVLTVVVIAFLATASAVLPGFFGPKPVGAETPEGNSAVLVMEAPRKLTFNVSDSLPAITDSLIEVHFGDLDEAVVDTAKWVAWAESRGKHWATSESDSLVLVRGKNPGKPDDVGLFQIHEGGTHQDCLDADHNYLTLEGNLACARFLYNRRGFLDWDSSARVWRDRYSLGSTTDRTAEQIVVAGKGGVESIILDAPTDGMSPPIGTYGRKYCVKVLDDVAVAVIDDIGNRFEIANNGEWSTPPRYPKWFSFQSLGDRPAKISFSRIEPKTKCPSR